VGNPGIRDQSTIPAALHARGFSNEEWLAVKADEERIAASRSVKIHKAFEFVNDRINRSESSLLRACSG